MNAVQGTVATLCDVAPKDCIKALRSRATPTPRDVAAMDLPYITLPVPSVLAQSPLDSDSTTLTQQPPTKLHQHHHEGHLQQAHEEGEEEGGPTPQYIAVASEPRSFFDIVRKSNCKRGAVEWQWSSHRKTSQVITMTPRMKSVKGAVSCDTQTITPRPFLASSAMIANNCD